VIDSTPDIVAFLAEKEKLLYPILAPPNSPFAFMHIRAPSALGYHLAIGATAF